MRTLFSVAALLMILLTGCGGGSGGGNTTGPSSGIDVSGQWRYTGSLQSGDILCTGGLGTFQISQSGSQISGSFQNVGGECVLPDGRFFPITRSGQITNGSLSGTSIQFSFGAGWPHNATVSAVPGQPANGISGTSSLTVDFGGAIGTVTLNGSFNAGR